MPTYEYECTKCGVIFERFQSITDEPVKRCPDCRCKVKRLLGSGAGIIFKGKGFYGTDYRSADYKKRASEDKTKSTESAGSSSTDKPGGQDKKS